MKALINSGNPNSRDLQPLNGRTVYTITSPPANLSILSQANNNLGAILGGVLGSIAVIIALVIVGCAAYQYGKSKNPEIDG